MSPADAAACAAPGASRGSGGSGAASIAAVQAATGEAELLIADGHHRYETMQAYAQEVGGEGEHSYILMCLVALEDPGLTVFATHRLVSGLDDQRRAALAQALERDFDMTEVPIEQIAPSPGSGPLQLGYFDGRDGRAMRLTLKDQAIADAALATARRPIGGSTRVCWRR